jgi:hypothetical protein
MKEWRDMSEQEKDYAMGIGDEPNMLDKAQERTGAMSDKTEEVLFGGKSATEFQETLVETMLKNPLVTEWHYDSDIQAAHEAGKHPGCEECMKMSAEQDNVREIPITLTQYNEAQPSQVYNSYTDPFEESAQCRPSVKTLKDVINELITMMAEVGNVDVRLGNECVEGIPHIEYDEDTDSVVIL